MDLVLKKNKASKLTIYRGASEALTMSGVVAKDGRKPIEADLGIIKSPILVTSGNQIVFVASKNKFNTFFNAQKSFFKSAIEKNVKGKTLMPGFVESHTHLVFGGDRKHEFELRNQGVSYQEISRQGGGIAFTVEQTRKKSEAALLLEAQKRLDAFKKQGVVLLEAKSGYGLDLKSELKILRVIHKLKGIKVIPSFLGLHDIPKGVSKGDYLQDVLSHFLPEVHKKKLASRADIFVEKKYFDSSDLKKMKTKLDELGWSFCAHTDQLTNTGSSLEAALLGASSVEHCVHMSSEDIKKISKTKTVLNLLPAADFFLKINYPNARLMIDQGCKVSLATDFNPGSSPTQNINFVGLLARLEMKMTLPEVISSYTFNAASALDQQNNFGALLPGYSSQFQALDQSWRDLFYTF